MSSLETTKTTDTPDASVTETTPPSASTPPSVEEIIAAADTVLTAAKNVLASPEEASSEQVLSIIETIRATIERINVARTNRAKGIKIDKREASLRNASLKLKDHLISSHNIFYNDTI